MPTLQTTITVVNNNFSNKMVDKQIKQSLEQNPITNKNKEAINAFYKNQIHKNSHVDKKNI